jgi:hypothetical protein
MLNKEQILNQEIVNENEEFVPVENEQQNDYVEQYGQEIVERAKKWGWKEDHKSESKPFVDPKTFVDNIENEIPNLRKAARKSIQLEERLQKKEEDMQALFKYQEIERKARVRQMEREKEEMLLKLQRDYQDAVDEGDHIKARQVMQKELKYNQDYEEVKREFETIAPPPQPTQWTPDESHLIQEWTQKNSAWYHTNANAQQEANTLFNQKISAGYDVIDAIEVVNRQVASKYNYIQQNTNPANTPLSISSARVPNPTARYSWDNLTNKAKEEYEMYADLYKRNKQTFTKEQFIKDCKEDKTYWKNK